MEEEPNKQSMPTRPVEQPIGLQPTESQPKPEWIATYRKFDSEDVVRYRSASLLLDLSGNQRVDLGGMQKAIIVLGVRKCPWFSDTIDDRHGVTDEIYLKRMKEEFRKIPIQDMDKLFKEAAKFNNIKDWQGDELKKE